ncbi:MAG: hypothetical protein RMX68_026545 [Aulosira sp. ZfuVER01]|nr:hypothetical protein [Aulosira sp. ZfuVER01]MDZ7999761.1 hypothetical protein [Aulosira sp. DedVER01a]MDZ8055126.1 hypothetical protein [Aulosira sp. ZfuCHP01]
MRLSAVFNLPRFLKLIINLVVLGALLFLCQRVWAQDWRPVRGGIPFGISGMALIEQQTNSLDFLIVHDNKKANQGRVAIISIKGKNQPEYLALTWTSKAELPNDLEALTSIPRTQNTAFIALSSSGKAYYIKLEPDKKTISVVKDFNLPTFPQGSNFEAFSLQDIDGKLVAVWAHRGEAEQPATLYWGLLDLTKYQIMLIGSTTLTVPFPFGKVRHISDIKIDQAGVVFISAASDPGDDGPFQSAIYIAGSLGYGGNKILFKQNPQLVPIYRTNYHKIEALELIPGAEGGVIVGTDDENFGSAVYIVGGE